ncbi:unnamed protein product [Rotaria sp. Silwood1]|nr:unnamed protein product [Rotaria sp. Silwood1]CAF0952116.1 unnamed protein product [Rotaria sp. Silwood1]CAF3377829.1 unnamed protein product [Rotaria sp. Silwood1]CAF4588825.1 unnamed protein product [Rotaria sp. Silwood1]
MIALVYVTIVLLAIYFLFNFLKPDSKGPTNPHAHIEETPEQMSIPIYRPFKDGPFQMTMNLQSLDTHDWIQIDPYYRQHIRLKQELLNSARRNYLFLYKDETYDASMEVLQMLIEYLPYQYPNMFQRNHSKTKIINLITRQIFDLTESDHMHPLEIAALLVQEDLVIMQRHPNEEIYHANALAVCFPSGWLPKSKFGLPLALVHIPHVPFFQEKLRMSMDRYFLKLKEDSPIQRLNWSLQVGNNLCDILKENNSNELITKDNAGQLMYLRVERQTLRRLPKSDTILFTIKTYMTKIEDVCRNNPDMAKRLAGAIRNWPPEMIKYKGADQYKDGLLAYLDIMSSI